MRFALKKVFLLPAFIISFTSNANPSCAFNDNRSGLVFTENKGQLTDQYGKSRNDIDFKLKGKGIVMFVGNSQLHYQWYRKHTLPNSSLEGNINSPLEASLAIPVDMYRMDVELIGSNKNAEVITEEQQEYTENYYLPQCPDGVTAKSYTRVSYKNVYPYIDWVVYTTGAKLKYDFIIHRGGNYKNIKIRYNGVTKLELKDGSLIATTPFGSITENAPYTYYADNKEEIKSNFILNDNILSYNTSPPSERPGEVYIIDPILKWATYYGGSSDEINSRITADTAANAILAGTTLSTNNIATTGAYQTSLIPDYDGYIAKFNKTGTLLWATYYGGDSADGFTQIACDISGNIYACGATNSIGLATTGVYQTTVSNGTILSTTDAFLVKFNSNGQRQWATYYGDTSSEQARALACDAAGNVYIGGLPGTSGTNTMASSGAYQTTKGLGIGFLAKFSSSGSRIWGTYFNGAVQALTTDALGNVFITGAAPNLTGIATTGAYQINHSGTGYDGYLAKFNSSGNLLWGTFYGGSAVDWMFGVSCDALGNVYMGGGTASTGLASAGSHQPLYGGSIGDGLFVKFNGSGVRQWATYYGGSSGDKITGISTGSDGNIYVLGVTNSTTGIATTGSYQPAFAGNVDAFIAIFDNNGVRKYATYYGGMGNDGGSQDPIAITAGGVVSSSYGKLYFGSASNSVSGIATSGSHQASNAGVSDAYLVQFDADTSVFLTLPYYDTFRCAGDSIHVPFGVTQNFRSTNTFTLQLSNASGSFVSPTTLGTISGGAPGIFHCIVPTSVTTGNGYRIRVLGSAPADTSEDNGIDLRYAQFPATPVASANSPCSGNALNLNASGTSTAVWSWSGPGSFTANTQNTNITSAQTTHSGNYIVSANMNNGCIKKDTVSVTVNLTPAKPNAGSNSPLCGGNTLNLTASTITGGVSWNWTGPMGFGNTNQNPSVPNVQTNQAGDYIVTATLGPCSNNDTTTVVVNPGPTINTYVNPKDTICAGGTVTLVALVTNGGSGPSYQWYKNGNPIGGATLASYLASGINNGDVFYCQFTPGTGTGCNGTINSSSITITVLPITNPSVIINASPDTNIWQGLNVTFTATPANCSKPAYQWKRNNSDVGGATSNTWGAATLLDNDQISCVMTCNDPCPNPKDANSNKLTIHVAAGIDGINSSQNIIIYPNPNEGDFTITTSEKGILHLINLQGQFVCKYSVETGKTNISLPKNLTSGIYIGRFVSINNQVSMLRIVYKP